MELNREVGEIKMQVRYLAQEVGEVKRDVKTLLSFKWRIIGFSAGASFLASVLFTALVEFYRRQS